MKNTLLLLFGASALSLASCSQEKTADTTTTTAVPADGAATTTTTVSDATYKTRGTRMADKFASDMKISDEPTKEKLRTAYYNRSKRYDELMAKYKADTAGYAAARRDYNKATDQEFQTILLVPAQYNSYQSSRPTYDEASNLDTADQTAGAASATMPSDSSSTTTNSTATTEEAPTSTMSGANVAKGKTKMTDGSKLKVKDDGTVKVKDAAGNKTKM
ncbi:hypothetical protein A0257_08365 [Hymenobacter psoromatis]|nr:hypothetical protein A0257_08365 [Hymenobacter psoromatis]